MYISRRDCSSSVVTGVSILTLKPDAMHSKHLGVDGYFFASVLFLVTYVMAGDKNTNVETVWLLLREQYRVQQTPTRFNCLKASMLEGSGPLPYLKGKAAEVRYLCRPLLAVFLALYDPEDLIHRTIKIGLVSSVAMEDTMARHHGPDVFKLPADAADELMKAATAYAAVLSSLTNHFHQQGIPLFHYTIKAHYLLHLAYGARWLHPYLGWCYSGEDLMHKAKVLTSSCLIGTKHHKACGKAIRRYAIGAWHRLCEHIPWRL